MLTGAVTLQYWHVLLALEEGGAVAEEGDAGQCCPGLLGGVEGFTCGDWKQKKHLDFVLLLFVRYSVYAHEHKV